MRCPSGCALRLSAQFSYRSNTQVGEWFIERSADIWAGGADDGCDQSEVLAPTLDGFITTARASCLYCSCIDTEGALNLAHLIVFVKHACFKQRQLWGQIVFILWHTLSIYNYLYSISATIRSYVTVGLGILTYITVKYVCRMFFIVLRYNVFRH